MTDTVAIPGESEPRPPNRSLQERPFDLHFRVVFGDSSRKVSATDLELVAEAAAMAVRSRLEARQYAVSEVQVCARYTYVVAAHKATI